MGRSSYEGVWAVNLLTFVDVRLQICLRLLLTFAIENSDRQLILLSPQDVRGVEQARQDMQDKFPSPEHFFKLVSMKPARPSANAS